MQATFPGTTIEVTALEKGSSKILFEGIFATGGITLSQVCIMTGLEPYVVQNWVKRGFLSSPIGRVYSKEQFARVVIINMLREALQIEKICSLLHIIGGTPKDKSDDLISDDELYHRYVDMLAAGDIFPLDPHSASLMAERAVTDFAERVPGAKKQLAKILQVMLYAHTASKMRDKANEMLSTLE